MNRLREAEVLRRYHARRHLVCERELRDGQGGRPLHLPDGVVLSEDANGRGWRTAVEVELTRKTEPRVAAGVDGGAACVVTDLRGQGSDPWLKSGETSMKIR